MNGVASLLRQTTASLLALQNAIQASKRKATTATPSEDEAPSAELIAELKNTIDRTRLFLWRYSESGSFQQSEDRPAAKDDHRLKLASEFLWLLSRQAAPDGSTEENMSFFERIDSISDRLLAEHPENKSSSKAA